MSASGSILGLLISTHDLKLVCAQCSIQENEITYMIKSVPHQCAHNLFLCRATGGSKWRPVSRRPAFPNPIRYMVCNYYVEGRGCTEHKNRCTFARSEEEAAVWNFEKHQKLDHASLCSLVAQSARDQDKCNPSEPLGDLLETLDLKVVCDLCHVRKKEITYEIKPVSHKCKRDQLLAKTKISNQWRPVSERPTCGPFGQKVFYQVCRFYDEGSGCTQHGQKCTYARSYEEATVWNYARDKGIDKDQLIRLITESASVITPESAAQNILLEFSGVFIELCKECYYDRPQKLTHKRWTDTCSADAAHTWNPVLVHHLSENNRKHIYSQVRPLPPNCQFEYCNHVRQGKPCWHEASHCMSAQSEVEMAVWKAEQNGLAIRPHLLQLSKPSQVQSRQVRLYCKICCLDLLSPESFFNHCSSVEHALLLSEDTTTIWRGRQPPHNRRAEFWLCGRPKTCVYGDNCPKAHSVEELKEWMMQTKEEMEVRHNIEAEGLMSYNETLLEEYRNSSKEVPVISEQVDDVSISCDKELTVDCEQIDATVQWKFQVETERQLVHVALLKQEPGAAFTLDHTSSSPCIYSSGEFFARDDMTYDITVSFTCINPGSYEQWLVLDFNIRPVLLKKLRVRVGQRSTDETEQPAVGHGVTLKSVERWHQENRLIIPCVSKTEEHEFLLKEYKPPQINFLYKSSHNTDTPLNPENYKARMHHFLYKEEQAEDQVVSRLNFCGQIKTLGTISTAREEQVTAQHGELFCAVSVPCNLTANTPEGQALKRSIRSGLIAPLSSGGQNTKVYEAKILHEHASEDTLYLYLHRRCCSDLSLKSNESYEMEVQFQLDRYSFCTMHKAVDLLPDTRRVLPDFQTCGVPENKIKDEKLNTKQQSAVNFITGDTETFVAPLLIYGPFGTGKTFTLATAARWLCKQPGNKVLICTHTNSSADLYIHDHFHPFIDQTNDGIRPIRVKANTQTALFATDDITLKYCLLSEDRQSFLPPTKAVLDRHKIVITTTMMARRFHDLKLPEGYFTHILIDEASQMLEHEALIALGLAGPNTRVVLAGDHMQMGPKLFSVDDYHRSDHTLLNRLFHLYQSKNCDSAQKSRIIFGENYRSTKEIVDFVSAHFYVGKNDVIKATGNIPPPANGHAFKFHHVRGECFLDTLSMSWYNKEEVAKAVEEVRKILGHWPSTWGTKDQNAICVLSEGHQVRQIRSALSRTGFSKVHVENYANVQGKQFRAVIIVTVQTRESLKGAHLQGLELFNDARVLNTAMTRAQSQVVVVGDAAALCHSGTCSRIWKSYIDHCINNSSVAPPHFTRDFFEKDVKEMARFQKSEHLDETNILNDEILQEMKDEYEQLKMEYSSDEDSLDFQNSHHHFSRQSHYVSDVSANLLKLCEKQPEMYKQGKLVRESYNRGYVIPFDSLNIHINIKGRGNLGKAFSGDEVLLQTATATQTAKVVSITKPVESARLLLCFLEDQDYSKPIQTVAHDLVKRMMVPFVQSAPKICILIKKSRSNFIPVWKQIDGWWTATEFHHLKESHNYRFVFQVQVIGWKDHCSYPLGYVTDVIPVANSLGDELWLLRQEFEIAPKTDGSDEYFDDSLGDIDGKPRQNMSKVITFTVDPAVAKDLDDAISVRDAGDHYELGIHITDVASFVRRGDRFDEAAKERGTTYYCRGQEPEYMFPKVLSTNQLSLLPGQLRRVVSLLCKVQKETHKIIGKPTFQLSHISSDRKLSYEDAEQFIDVKYKEEPRFNTVEDCVAVAYCFAKAQRKSRLADWPYAQPDDHRVPGKRKAQLMIEELNVLFNSLAAETLISSQKTRSYTPLRCQARPDQQKLEEFKEKCKGFIPLSFHVREKVDHDNEVPDCETFRVVKEIWSDIQSAVTVDDTDKIVDLVAADDIHPLLQPVIDQFRECSNKAYVIRFNSSSRANVGHYSLNKRPYTQASSPIRRYMDIILQRLLHSVICDSDVQYTRREIDSLCNNFEHNLQDAKRFEQKTEQVIYAVSMIKQNAPKLAFVVSADPDGDSFSISFPFNKSIFAKGLQIMYKDLQLEDPPSYDKENHCITLTWKKRIFAAENMQVQQGWEIQPHSGTCIELPMTTWRETVRAIDNENWDRVKCLIMNANIVQLENHNQPAEVPQDHHANISLPLQPGDTLKIQMTCKNTKRYYQVPAVQLVHITPMFQVCVDHVQNPIPCFSRSAYDHSRDFNRNINDYIQMWKPLCEMESVATAVDESDSIVIENLEVTFKEEQQGILKGSFSLPLAWINEYAVECNLSKCLLCIRKRGLTSTLEHSAEVDPKEYTWVAHGVTYKVGDLKSGRKSVEFNVNHLPMETIPECVFQKNTQYTVEIIPKLLPDIRKENAVVNLPLACDLVKNIALGKRISESVVSNVVQRYHIMRAEQTNGLPRLNESQYLAVDRALNKAFTIIQGPPGTGKTVVGAYLVYWFVELNSINTGTKDKQQVVLYCGPSNKSVDVVAEYLMKFGKKLKPLRVYSQQVEMLDYPYPDHSLQFSPRTLRQDRSKQELRSITLHHRMREEQNPSSEQIRQFDERIRNEEELTADEVKKYKDLLKDARAHELRQHNVVLCTCTQSSTPSLTNTVSARQILVDECAMATEPQTLIPLVCNKPEKVVLIGDHKQLQPIVKNEQVRKLGMARSLFERYHKIHEKKVMMLKTQYRMHEDICKFPSEAYYGGELETGVQQPPSVLRVGQRVMPIVFGHIQGKTIHQVTKTAKGNFNSKANPQERDQVIRIADKLVKKAKVEQQSIAILSPYNAQVAEIKEILQSRGMTGITVTTVTKSQGSEWRYVILSTVCSLPTKEIERDPDGAWLSKHVGSVGYPTQINVGITRAKEGLCIIGNQELLSCSHSWKKLLDHYRHHNAVTDAQNISLQGIP
ncbi:3'-5' exoribonuclease HELZ2-like [Aulostomus maculatus]